ncbi:MAG: hypothetical protein ACJ8GK_00290 [Luteimonas sp.]
MHTILADPAGPVVLVQYLGNVSVQDRERALSEVRPLLQMTGLRKILVDFRGARCVVDGFSRSKALASRLSGDPLLRECRIAYVSDEGSRLNPVVDTLSCARGMVFERFPSQDEARTWLEC